jgi:hypothetical protein
MRNVCQRTDVTYSQLVPQGTVLQLQNYDVTYHASGTLTTLLLIQDGPMRLATYPRLTVIEAKPPIAHRHSWRA